MPELVKTLLSEAGRRNIPVGFDPKDNHELPISGLTLATPNFREACLTAGLTEVPLEGDPESDERLGKAAAILLEKWNTELLIITLGPHGMYLASRGEKPKIIPTKAREVYDVSGAGDTVIAAAILSCVSGADFFEAASLANYAAGIVVGKVGTATCTKEELLSSVNYE